MAQTYRENFGLYSSENDYTLHNNNTIQDTQDNDITYKKTYDKVLYVKHNKMPPTPKKKKRTISRYQQCASECDMPEAKMMKMMKLISSEH